MTDTEKYRCEARKIVYEDRVKELMSDFHIAPDRATLFAKNDLADGRLKPRIDDTIKALRNYRRGRNVA